MINIMQPYEVTNKRLNILKDSLKEEALFESSCQISEAMMVILCDKDEEKVTAAISRIGSAIHMIGIAQLYLHTAKDKS